MVKQVELDKIFNRGEILYLQGASSNASITQLNKNTKNSTRRLSRELSWFADIKDGDKIEMPIVMVMLSPRYQIAIYQGEEAYPFLNLFDRLQLDNPPDIKTFNAASKDAVNMINGLEPKFSIFKKEGFWKDNSGITQLTKVRLHLKKEPVQFRLFGEDEES